MAEVVGQGVGSALLRVDVQVTWYPPRSAAEYINPENYRAVKVDAVLYGHSVRDVRRTLSARGVIIRLARLLNSLPLRLAGTAVAPPCRRPIRSPSSW